MSADLIDLVQRLGQPRVLVVGDLMLDRYVWGDAERISQEAPVILLHADRARSASAGPAASPPCCAPWARRCRWPASSAPTPTAAASARCSPTWASTTRASSPTRGRPTTVKERYIGRAQHRHPQQMIRVDYEVRDARRRSRSSSSLRRRSRSQLRQADIVLISDYDKGVCTPALLAGAHRRGAGRAACASLADPIRGSDYRKYHGCSAITPNRLEAGLATGRDARTTATRRSRPPRELREQLDLEAAIVTLDKDGMALVHRDGRRQLFPTRPRQVYDITGAGDMVHERARHGPGRRAPTTTPAIRLANVAGGLEVEKIGVATVTRDEILRDLLHARHGRDGAAAGKVAAAASAASASSTAAARLGQRVAFTNGCFDVLHAGHVQYLQEARAQADVLVVGLNSDASVRRSRARAGRSTRWRPAPLVLAGLQAVDYVTVFDEATPLELIRGRPARRAGQGGRLPPGRGGRRRLRRSRTAAGSTWRRCARGSRPRPDRADASGVSCRP